MPRSLITMLVGIAFIPGAPAYAVQFGEIVQRSSLGEPFAARIPLQIDAGEEFSAACVTILPSPDASRGVPLPPRLRASIEIVSGKHYLALRNAVPNNEPVVGMRLEFTCNDLEAMNYVVLPDPAVQETQTLASSTESIGQPRAAQETPARPRRQGTVSKARSAKPAGRQQESKSTPQPAESQVALPESSYPLRPDFGPLDLTRKAGTAEQPTESLRAITPANTGHEEAVAVVNERIRNLEAEVVALREQLEMARQAAATDAAPQAAMSSANIVPSVDNWALYGAPPLLVLVGLFAWWRRRKQQPIASYPWEDQATAIKQRAQEASAPVAAAPADDWSTRTPLSPSPPIEMLSSPTFAEAQRQRVPNAPQQPEVSDPAAMLPEEIKPIDFGTVALPGDEPAAAPMLSDLFELPGDNVAAQETYFTGRFGGNSEDVKILHDLDTVIEQARSFFEDDNDPVKAADLLELAAALHPSEVRPWLALFAIYRRASMPRQYATLAEKFQNTFPADSNWPTIRQLGWEIDADNLLYEGTVGTEGADRTAEEVSQEATDRWLDVPLDFTSVLLADELRDAVTRTNASTVPLAASGG